MAAIKQLAAVTRSGTGKGAARSVRREGRVPAVIYGGGVKPEPISVDYKDVNKFIYAGHFLTSIFELEIDGRKERVLPRDYQLDVVTDRPVHVDFLRLAPGSQRAHRHPRACRQSRSLARIEKGRRGQSGAAHGRGHGACRRHSGIDHHRPCGHGFPRFGACVRAQAAGRLPADQRHGGTDGGDDRARRRSWSKRRPRPARRPRPQQALPRRLRLAPRLRPEPARRAAPAKGAAAPAKGAARAGRRAKPAAKK